MKVLLFGATGMVGQGVLRECLQAADVELVQTIGRTPTGQQHPKLRERVQADMWHYDAVAAELAEFDACYYCIGVTSSGLSEEKYTHLTYDMTLAAAEALARVNPQMVFVYVSAAGADSKEQSRLMWERVRGRTENALFKLPFRATYVFRPGMIEPLDGIKSRTTAYRIFYSLTKPLLPLLRAAMPNQVLSTRLIGQAMLAVTRSASRSRVLEMADIAQLAKNVRA
ncbi:MAG TPA: NAD-dependent epimerase/dehydratase family protein [Telluria sp.]